MPAWIYYLGILCITYFVSRATWALLDRVRPAPPRSSRRRERSTLAVVAPPHLLSFALIAAVIFWLRNYEPLQVLPYLPAQALWLGVDFLRRYRPVSRGRTRMVNPFRLPRAGTAIAAIMSIAAVGYGGRALATFLGETQGYAAVATGATPAEALYTAGAPTLTQARPDAAFRRGGEALSSAAWYYRSPPVLVRFDPANQRVESILCAAATQKDQASCPGVLLVGVGTFEWDVEARLGRATETQVFEGRKVLRYPELGLEFALERFAVRAIRAYPDDGSFATKLYRFVRYAIP